MIKIPVTTGPIQKLVEFQVVDIKPSFNLLLGRPWLHELGAVSSSLHQMVKLNYNGVPMTIHASPLKVEINETSFLEINHDDDDGDLWGFAAEGVHTLETDQDSIKIDPYSTRIINNILFKSGYFPGMPLGVGLKKTISPPTPNKGLTFGLGYDPSDQELEEHLAFLKSNKILARKGVIPLLPSFKRTLNGQFVREGENRPYYGFPEPLVRGGIQKPGFEIFHDCHFLDCAPIIASVKHSAP